MPFSLNFFNHVFQGHLAKINPNVVLDVGAGEGKYGRMIREWKPQCHLDAIEPSAQYIEKFALREVYNQVFDCTVQDFVIPYCKARYNIVIFGDILEHMFKSQAMDYLDFFLYRSDWVMLAWPTNMPQDDCENNHYEIHKSNFKLADLANQFEVHHYERRFAWYQGMGVNDSNFSHSEYHYAMLKGHVTRKTDSL